MLNLICSLSSCGLPFYRKLDNRRHNYIKYCSRDCYRLAVREFHNSPYPRIWYNGKREYLHRVIYMQATGETLTSIDIIHHKDSNPYNRNPNNLEKLTDTEHAKKHYQERSGMFRNLPQENFEQIDGHIIKW